ncbi:hypothetical protein XPA_001587 [Xanthoria parietina]
MLHYPAGVSVRMIIADSVAWDCIIACPGMVDWPVVPRTAHPLVTDALPPALQQASKQEPGNTPFDLTECFSFIQVAFLLAQLRSRGLADDRPSNSAIRPTD